MDFKPQTIQVRKFILGEFIKAIKEAELEGYIFNEYEVWRLGGEYLVNMSLPAVFQAEAVKVSEVVEKTTVEGDSGTDVPDWEKLDAFVKAEDKDGMEAYCKGFGIDLNKRKSPANMYKEFKKHVGAED